jgi:hypothetical protein
MKIRRVVGKDGALRIGKVHDNADRRVACWLPDGEPMRKGIEVWFLGGRWYGSAERIMLYAGPQLGSRMFGYAKPVNDPPPPEEDDE